MHATSKLQVCWSNRKLAVNTCFIIFEHCILQIRIPTDTAWFDIYPEESLMHIISNVVYQNIYPSVT